MEFTRKMLKNFGLASEIPSFDYHEIDDEIFNELNIAMIKQLIPRIGRQVKFLRKYKEYLKLIFNDKDNYEKYIAEHLLERACYPSSSAIAVASTSTLQNVAPDATTRKIADNAGLAKKAKCPLPNSFNSSAIQWRDCATSPIPDVVYENSLVLPKLEPRWSPEEPEQSTWQDLIDKVTRGKAILVAFARNLPNKKNDLANFIIDLEMRKDASLKISSERFEELANSVVERFPEESKDWYFYSKKRQKSSTARGVLYETYQHKRQKYMKLGLIQRSLKRSRDDDDESGQNSLYCDVSLEFLTSPSSDGMSPKIVLPEAGCETAYWQSLLTKITRGRAVLMAFKKNAPARKNDLANFIIDLELEKDVDFKIQSARFEELAASIIQVFPEEQKRDYFTPSIRTKRIKSVVRGVLYDTYQHKRRKYLKIGLIEKRTGSFSAQDEYEDEQTNGEMKEIQFETVAIVEDWNIEIRKRSNSEDFETDETLKKMCFSESDC